ncbi:hypothetical protein [Actinocrispum sp. NPDC049592]|uniref:hypothetical protein n=1 Tax=Actinocrispum sp. NPDC049592 TaxID=3154835 RepID=UPI00341373EA
MVLKPGRRPAVASWLAEVFAGLGGEGFRASRPVRAADGGWVVDGWTAWTAVEGEPAPLDRWPELVAASRAFHAAIADIPAPDWIGRGRNRWAVAERFAWDGERVEVAPELADLVDSLRASARPVRLPAQLVHGDIAGNVLFAPGKPPAVIDFSPTRRPAGYALAVAAVDLLTWSAAPPDILDELSDEDDIDQLLLRALVWRLVTESLGRSDADSLLEVRRATEPVVDLVLSRMSGRAPARGPDLAAVTGRLLGCEITGLRPVPGGHSRSLTRLADRADGGAVFIKAGGHTAAVELAVYEALRGRTFVPRLLASTQDSVLVLEALPRDGWVRDWTPQLVAATRALLHEVHALPAPQGIPRLGAVSNPWDVIAADRARLLRMGVCSDRWLGDHLDTLHEAAAQAPTEGDSLIHRDVRAANLWCQGDRLVLADWASAAIGDPWLDLHLWLVALHAEGGPAPEAGQGRHAIAHAALIAGQQPLITPARDADPALFEQRRRRLTVALSWAARLLELPVPQGRSPDA